MTARIMPHTAEWLFIVEATDPYIAFQTRAILIATNRKDVCGICADDTALDFELRRTHQSKRHTILTLRLCRDCRVRKENAGEELIPILQPDEVK